MNACPGLFRGAEQSRQVIELGGVLNKANWIYVRIDELVRFRKLAAYQTKSMATIPLSLTVPNPLGFKRVRLAVSMASAKAESQSS